MLANFYIPGLSNDMKIAVQTNHLVGQISYRSLVPPKKSVNDNLLFFKFYYLRSELQVYFKRQFRQ